MLQLNLHDARARFSELLARVQSGETVVIAKNGRLVAKLVPLSPKPLMRRPFGTGKKLIHYLADFNAPLPKVELKAFGRR